MRRWVVVIAVVLCGNGARAVGADYEVYCPADCDADGEVTVSELVAAVSIALGGPLERCTASDGDGSETVSVDELVTAVNAALSGVCRRVTEPAIWWGVDANYVRLFEQQGRIWRVGGRSVDPIAVLADHGANTFRLRVWVENDPGDLQPGTLDRHARLLARRAQHLGLYVMPTLFMSRGWGADTEQDVPADWQSLTIQERAGVAREWAAQAAARLRRDGIRTRVYGIGNETDYGFCGAFEQTEDIERLRRVVWPAAALLMRATAEGVRRGSGRPDLAFVVHISRGWDPDFAVDYFRTMISEGVPISLAGLSYYPNSWGQQGTDRFAETVRRLWEELGLRVFIAEYAYAAEDRVPGWNVAVDGYSLDEDGQARFVADLRSRVFADDRLAGAVYWTPEEAHAFFDWAVMGLFRPSFDGRSPAPRPALDALGSPRG